ncbi:MAG: hypothetical protein ACR2NZ_17705 [Rubripirellula sp.]
MHLLPCPNCQTEIQVAPSQAGDSLTCPECQTEVAIPRLGDLRQLPRAEQSESEEPTTSAGASGPARGGFLALAGIALGSLLIAGYCGIRWGLIDVPATTDEHIAMIREQYASVPPAKLIREYEQMDRDGIDLGSPYTYKKIGLEKEGWGRNASIAGGVGFLALLGAAGLAAVGRKR